MLRIVKLPEYGNNLTHNKKLQLFLTIYFKYGMIIAMFKVDYEC